MQPARDRTGPSSGQGDRWAHLCFLLLGSGSGDWAAWGKVATPEHQATAGCQRPWAITKTCCSLVSPPQRPITANVQGLLFLLVAQISVVRLTTLLHQWPMNGRIDKVGGSASQPVCVATGAGTQTPHPRRFRGLGSGWALQHPRHAIKSTKAPPSLTVTNPTSFSSLNDQANG